MTAVIEVIELQKIYGSGLFRKPLAALRGISLSVQPGEIFGLLGPNGAGKTTLIKILLGIVRKSSGSAFLLGLPAGDLRSRQRIGYLPENLRIASHHTAISAMNYYGRLSRLSGRQIAARRDQLLELVGLRGRTQESVKRYSKGMLQRLGLAQALLHDPDLLILDEPTDGLDPLGRSQIRKLLLELKSQGKTVFLNSHILQEVEMVCDRVAIMNHGTILALGPVSELAAHEATGIELNLTAVGPEAAIRDAIAGYQLLHWEALSADHIRARFLVAGQSEVDGSIDRLRSRGVSILALHPHRRTLEDAYVRLIGSSAAADAAAPSDPGGTPPSGPVGTTLTAATGAA